MRVISGKYKGKKLLGYDILSTRPTMDRVKESVFASIQNKLNNSTFLDLFAGSGSIGIEALSNGSKSVYFVDQNKDIISILKKNTKDMDDICILNKDFKDALRHFKDNNIKFDIIYIDPPYHLLLVNECLKIISDYDLLNQDGLIIVEYEEEIVNDIYELYKYKKFGKTNIKIYKKSILK